LLKSLTDIDNVIKTLPIKKQCCKKVLAYFSRNLEQRASEKKKEKDKNKIQMDSVIKPLQNQDI
jgi:hypothetical protein